MFSYPVLRSKEFGRWQAQAPPCMPYILKRLEWISGKHCVGETVYPRVNVLMVFRGREFRR